MVRKDRQRAPGEVLLLKDAGRTAGCEGETKMGRGGDGDVQTQRELW